MNITSATGGFLSQSRRLPPLSGGERRLDLNLPETEDEKGKFILLIVKNFEKIKKI